MTRLQLAGRWARAEQISDGRNKSLEKLERKGDAGGATATPPYKVHMDCLVKGLFKKIQKNMFETFGGSFC